MRHFDTSCSATLLESRPRLGGRASSFNDPKTGDMVDNCQHVSMACCTNLADFCRRVGIEGLFRREPAVTFLGPDGRTHGTAEQLREFGGREGDAAHRITSAPVSAFTPSTTMSTRRLRAPGARRRSC